MFLEEVKNTDFAFNVGAPNDSYKYTTDSFFKIVNKSTLLRGNQTNLMKKMKIHSKNKEANVSLFEGRVLEITPTKLYMKSYKQIRNIQIQRTVLIQYKKTISNKHELFNKHYINIIEKNWCSKINWHGQKKYR